jgi:hypothetical protein
MKVFIIPYIDVNEIVVHKKKIIVVGKDFQSSSKKVKTKEFSTKMIENL